MNLSKKELKGSGLGKGLTKGISKRKTRFAGILVLVMAMIMLVAMTVNVFASPSPNYTITNSGTQFAVAYGNTTLYNSFPEALAACTNTANTITFGDASNVLQVDASGPGYALHSFTYKGRVNFTLNSGGSYGLCVASGDTASFSNLTVTNNLPATADYFIPIVVNEGATLNVGAGTSIKAVHASTSNYALVSNSGTLNVNDGIICGDANTQTAICNIEGATLNVTGGIVKSIAVGDFGTAISNSGDVTVSGGQVTAAGRGISSEKGSVTVNAGIVEAIGSGEAHAILTRNGNVKVTGGLVQGTSTGFSSGILYVGSVKGGKIEVSGGTVSSAGTSRKDCGAIVLDQDGTTEISGTAIVTGAKNGICFMMNDSPTNAITISGGTVESMDDLDVTDSDAGAAVNVSDTALSTVTVTGGTLRSANNNTLKLTKGTAATAKIVAYGLNIYRSSEADVSVKGVLANPADNSSMRVFSDTSATVNAANFDPEDMCFAGWTSDSAREQIITGVANGGTIADLLASNTNAYLKIKALPVLTKEQLFI